MSEKKSYAIGCYTPEDWTYIHEVLVKDGTLEDNIPSRSVEVGDIKDHSETRAVYLLDDDEVAVLKNHPKVRFVSLDLDFYAKEIMPPPEELYNVPPITQKERLPSSVKIYRNFYDSGDLPTNPTVTEAGRTGYQILRCTEKNNQWAGTASNTIINNDTITTNNNGAKNVDVIVGDDGCWFGHVEFQSNATGTVNPTDYVGGNVLGGTCDLLDLILDAPYYIDPYWFNADPGARLITRWDGATVPVESEAKQWWSNNLNRSIAFIAAGTVTTIPAGYTRNYCNGSKTTNSSIGNHGTPCCAATYGRTQGWAYNANKWFINAYNTNNPGLGAYFDLMKIFHIYKPVNQLFGSKDPTISSNSWGYRDVPPNSGYYYYRSGLNLNRTQPGVSYANKNLGPFNSSNTAPGFMKWVGYYGDSSRMKSEMVDNTWTIAGEEMIRAGVIFVVAAGNSNQKCVEPNHPDFNNFFNNTANAAVVDGSFNNLGVAVYPTTNRRGFPQHLGKDVNYVYPAINIGAIDDSFTSDGLERKVNYSDMGNSVDCYAPADGILTAQRTSTSGYGGNQLRYDTYTGNTVSNYDGKFGGTSAACPVACGLIACLLSNNRYWTWIEVKNYLKKGLEEQNRQQFFYGRESVTDNDSNWSDVNSLEGGEAKIIYELASSGKIDAFDFLRGNGLSISGPLTVQA